MTYKVLMTAQAEEHLAQWQMSGQKKVLQKITALFEELKLHPKTGTGQIEQLKGNMSGYWSRRINKDSRMLYTIEDTKVIVTVVSLKGHYGDK